MFYRQISYQTLFLVAINRSGSERHGVITKKAASGYIGRKDIDKFEGDRSEC